jgi:hypothetical protein
VVARLVLKRSSAGKLLYVGWAATAAVTAVCYRAISSALCKQAACISGACGRAASLLPASWAAPQQRAPAAARAVLPCFPSRG